MARSQKGAMWQIITTAAMSLLVGCVRKHVRGDTITYSPQPWVIALVAVVAGAGIVTGWLLRKRRKGLGYLLLGAGLLVLCTTVPGLALSKTVLDADHIEWDRGLKHYSFRFVDLASIVHTVKRIPIGRTMQDVHYLDFERRSGEVVHVQVEPGSDRFLQDAIPDLMLRARRKGVRCVETGP
jgi:hypothetical protein